MVADACNLACSKIYERSVGEWVDIGNKEATLFISTELELNELQTMALAFIADVNEEHILSGVYEAGESERVRRAIQILKESKLYVEVIPDFSIKDIENIIKRNIRLNKTHYVFFDYMHSSMKILEEISRRSGGVKLREDNILFLFSVQLKDLCTRFGVFIMTGTQLNGDFKTSTTPDQNLLRGAKAIADKSDVSMILLDVTQEDRDELQGIVETLGMPMPNVKLSVYKNRRGSFTKRYLWMTADKGTCRFNGLFATTYDYDLIENMTNVIPYSVGREV